jgi:hypothetical protein
MSLLMTDDQNNTNTLDKSKWADLALSNCIIVQE